MMTFRFYDEAYEGDKKLCSGIAKELAQYFNTTPECIYEYCRTKRLFHGIYTIRKMGREITVEELKEQKKPKRIETKPKKKEDEKLAWMKLNLERHGNTYIKEDPDVYRRKLAKLGIKTKCRKASDGAGYILEVK